MIYFFLELQENIQLKFGISNTDIWVPTDVKLWYGIMEAPITVSLSIFTLISPEIFDQILRYLEVFPWSHEVWDKKAGLSSQNLFEIFLFFFFVFCFGYTSVLVYGIVI